MKLEANTPIFLAGGSGLVGQALHRALVGRGCTNILVPTHVQLDLCLREAVQHYFEKARPQVVIMAAGLVGGIQANIDDQVGFLTQNMLMAEAVLSAAHKVGVKKLLYLGSSCIYPTQADLPLKESSLLTGPFEPTNEGYALAKSVGIKLAQFYRQQYGSNFICCLPTNLYGPADRYDDRKSHVVPALIQRLHKAKIEAQPTVVIWGSGKPLRDLLFVDDLALACLHLIEQYDASMPVNVASGIEHSISEIARALAREVGYRGQLVFDVSKPDGLFRKPQDLSIIQGLGWKPKTDLAQGLRLAYADYLARHNAVEH